MLDYRNRSLLQGIYEYAQSSTVYVEDTIIALYMGDTIRNSK